MQATKMFNLHGVEFIINKFSDYDLEVIVNVNGVQIFVVDGDRPINFMFNKIRFRVGTNTIMVEHPPEDVGFWNPKEYYMILICDAISLKKL